MPSSLLFKQISEKGFSALGLVLILFGVGIGVFLVQQRTNLFPQAKVDPSSSTEIKRDPLLGVRISDPRLFDSALRLGVSKVRVSVESADAFYNQTIDQKSFLSPITQIFKSAETNNIQLIIVVKPSSTVEVGDLENRIRLLAQHLGSNNNIVFELGNEPNGRNADGQNFWDGDYASFASFIRDASTAIRKHYPSTPIIIGALDLQGKINGSTEEAARADLNSYFDALSQKVTLANFDFAIHSYHNLEWFNRIYNLQKEELNKRNINPKLWLTETGVNLNQGDNPDSLVEIVKAAEAKNDIRGILVHALDSNDGFQLWSSAAPTASYTKLQEFVNTNPNSVSATIITKTSTGTNGSITPVINAADKSCSNNPITPPADNLVWHAFCAEEDYAPGNFSCNSNADCPQNTIQEGSGVNPATSSQCVQFNEGSRCIQLRLTEGYNAQDPAFETPNDTYINNPENIPFGQVGLGQSPGKEGDNQGPRSDFSLFLSSYLKKLERIKEDQRVKELLGEEVRAQQETLMVDAEKAVQEANAANDAWLQDKSNTVLAKQASDATKRAADAVAAAEALRKLAKLEEMLAGKTTEQCVKADLGIRPWLNARRIKARGEDTREDGSAGDKINRYLRLYVCSGKNANDLKWRVATEGNDNKQSFSSSNPDEEGSMERILRLHGDDENTPYPTPNYPFTEIEGGHVTLVGQQANEIRFALEKYINAAKAGKAVIE